MATISRMKYQIGPWVSAAVIIMGFTPALGAMRFPPAPDEGQFVRDEAKVLSTSQQQELNTLCNRLVRERTTPIFVVTIRSLSEQGAVGSTIEQYAQRLFDTWSIGHMDAPTTGTAVFDWNRGALVLVSVQDRKARIELGSGWEQQLNRESVRIMDTRMVPRFREQRFGQGLVDGVKALEQAMRTRPTRSAPAEDPRSPMPITPPNPATPSPPAPVHPAEAEPPVQSPPITYHPSSPRSGPVGLHHPGITGGFGIFALFVVVFIIAVFLKVITGIGRAFGGDFSGGGFASRRGGMFRYQNRLFDDPHSHHHGGLFGGFSSGHSPRPTSSGFGQRSRSSSSSFGSRSSHSSLGGGRSGGGGASGSW